MHYEIVHLQEKNVVGLMARTNNTAPDMAAVIGGLWEDFFTKGVYQTIPHKINDKTLGIYTDYAGDEKADYSVMVACESSNTILIPKGTILKTLPTGKYAKFIVKGPMQQAVSKFWKELWQMDLPRSFVCDFEEYQNGDMENAEIHIYIGLKD